MDMGFTIDRSTAGSSIRFDPPNPKDEVSIIQVADYLEIFAHDVCVYSPLPFTKASLVEVVELMTELSFLRSRSPGLYAWSRNVETDWNPSSQ